MDSKTIMELWLMPAWTALAMTLLTAVCVYAAVIGLVRLIGLRSFSQMSAFDFAVTVAVGSLIATSVATQNPPLVQALVALAGLFGLQYGVALIRRHSPAFKHVIDNDPLLLMAGPQMLQDHMRSARVTEDDLWTNLRKANITNLSQVYAVVMETTGDVTVIARQPSGPPFDHRLLTGVRGAELVEQYADGENGGT